MRKEGNIETTASLTVIPEQEANLKESFARTSFAQAIRAAGITEDEISSLGELYKPVYISFDSYYPDRVYKITNVNLVWGVVLESSLGDHDALKGISLNFDIGLWTAGLVKRTEEEFKAAK